MYRMYLNHTVPHIAPIEKMQSPQGKDDAFEKTIQVLHFCVMFVLGVLSSSKPEYKWLQGIQMNWI